MRAFLLRGSVSRGSHVRGSSFVPEMSSSTFIEPLDAHLESAIADKQPENSIEVFPSKISHITPPAIFAEVLF